MAIILALSLMICSTQAQIASAQDSRDRRDGAATAVAVSEAGASTDSEAIAAAAVDYLDGDAPAAVGLAEAASAVDAVPIRETKHGLVARIAGGKVEVDRDGDVTLSVSGAPTIGLSANGASSESDVVNGSVVHQPDESGAALVTRATADGFQIVAVLNDAPVVDDLTFQMDLPEGSSMNLQEDGSIALLAPSSSGLIEVAMLDRPWAVDATGNPVHTHYAVNGETVTQFLDVDAHTAFPVTADPRVRTAWYGFSVDFTRSDTIAIAAGGVGCEKVASKSPPGVGRAVQLSCGFLAGWAGLALAQGKCMSAKLMNLYVWAPWITGCYA